MVELAEIYDKVENPLNNQELIHQIVLAYTKSDRTNLFGSSNLYNFLVKMNKANDLSRINLSDKETFFIETYNQWIDNVVNLDDTQIKDLEENTQMDAGMLKQYLKSFGTIASMEEIKRLKSNPLFEEEINSWELNDGWEHIKSQYISARTESKISTKHRLYVGCQNQDMWKLAKLFKDKCDNQQIPYYFKLGASNDRDDKMVIYADTDNLGNYINALQEIAKENPEIIERCGQPPALTGKIDNWIGIGDEPPLKKDGNNQSYNSLRTEIFENAIEETILSNIAEFKGKDVTYKGKQTRFNDLFIETASQTIIQKEKDVPSPKLSSYGLKEEDLSNPKFNEYIKKHLRTSISKGLDKLIEVKDIKAQLAGSNRNAIFSIPTREGKKIDIDTIDMDLIIKSMVPIMQEIDSNFIDKVKSQIQDKCRQNGIDETFCFQQGSKERFEKIDMVQSVKGDDEITADDSGISSVGTRSNISIRHGLRADEGISQIQVEELEYNQEYELLREQEENAEKERQDRVKAQIEKISQRKKMNISEVKNAIKNGKITTSEKEKKEQEVRDDYAIAILKVKSQMGEKLTEEQQRQIDAYKNQKQQYNTQKNTKGMSLGR